MEKNIKPFQSDPSLKLMDRVAQALSYYQYAYRTKLSYTKWIKEYIRFLGQRKVPEQRFQKEIDFFLKHIETERRLSSSSCRQALNAISFLYKRVFDVPVDVNVEPAKIRKETALPVVITPEEVRRVLSHLKGKHLLMAQLLYGAGLRLMECVRLRVMHLNFKRNIIFVTPAKGGKRREVMMPRSIQLQLLEQVRKTRLIHEQDTALGNGWVDIPEPYTRKYKGGEQDFIWQYVFPAKRLSTLLGNDLKGRLHVMESGLQKAVQSAVKKAGVKNKVSCNTFRHCFAVHLLENNVPVTTVKDLMGHADIRTTQNYLQLLSQKNISELSPLDNLYA